MYRYFVCPLNDILLMSYTDLLSNVQVYRVFFSMTHNGLGLGEEGELKVQMFSLVQMFNRIPNVEVSTSAPFSLNPC